MTKREAIDYLEKLPIDTRMGNANQPISSNLINMSMEALEKQIPKEPFRGYIPRDLAVNCPSCNSFIGFSDQTKRYNYCPNCGQAIKWE